MQPVAVTNNRVPLVRSQRLLCQQWTEYQSSAGSKSPAGYTYHLDEGDHVAYVERHWLHLIAEHHGQVPDVYDFPNGDPYWVDVTTPVYEKVARSRLPGLRLWNKRPPAPEDACGVWRSVTTEKDTFDEHGTQGGR